MSKPTLLLIDGDTRSLRELEVSLRKSGFAVATAETVHEAVQKLTDCTPDLIISETKFEDGNGFDLRRHLGDREEWRAIPFVLLTAQTAIEDKDLEHGVDDCLTKPIYVKEIVARINVLLEKKRGLHIAERKDPRTRFVGRISDMSVVDVIQTIEISRKSGVITFVGERQQQAAIYFRDGKVIDAEAGTLLAEDAVYRLLTWIDGDFEVVFRMIRRREVIAHSSQALLLEGMRRLDEWTLLLEQLPSHASQFEIDTDELTLRLGGLPDSYNRVLRLIDGKRSLLELVESCDLGDLECLQVVVRLYFEGLLIDVSTPAEQLASKRPATSRMRAASEALSAHVLLVNDSEVVEAPLASERTQSADTELRSEEYEPSPLLGGYRKSSLLLIDAAVAAAEAVDGANTDGQQQWWQALGAGGLEGQDGEPAAAESTPALARIALVKASRLPAIELSVQSLGKAIEDAQVTDKFVVERELPLSAAEHGDPGVHDATMLVTTPATASVGGRAPDTDTRHLPMADTAEVAAIGAHVVAGEVTGEAPAADNGVPSTVADDENTSRSKLNSALPSASGEIRKSDPAAPRMISSLGKETAQVAGEVFGTHSTDRDGATAGPDPERRAAPARQIVTILPRRTTREMSVTAALAPSGPYDDGPKQAAITAAAASELTEVNASAARQVTAQADIRHVIAASSGPRAPRASVQIPVAGGTTRTSSSRRLLYAIGATLAASIALYTTCLTTQKSEDAVMPDPPAAVPAVSPDASATRVVKAVNPSLDAGGIPGSGSNRLAVFDAAPSGSAASESVAAGSLIKPYKELLEKASEALREGDAAVALRYASESIADRPTARGYVVKADALRRIGKNDDAVAAADSATRIATDYAPAWEMKGRVLWSAKRTAEATLAFKRFLVLEPKSKRADDVRGLIGE